jgi:hypothetical protein
MSYNDLAHEWFHLIVEDPGIGACFQDHGVCLAQMSGSPGGKTFEAEVAGREHDVLLAIHRSHDNIIAMHIQGHIPADLGRIVHG